MLKSVQSRFLQRAARGAFLPAMLALALAQAGMTAGQAAETPPGPMLWQIGQQDRADKEFALAPSHWNQYKDDADYVIGRSKPETDWPYVLPGPEDGWAGTRSHTADIYFALASPAPQGSCLLTISLIDAQQRVPPQIQVTVNGQTWTRDTNSGGGDESLNGQPSLGKPATLMVTFPSRLLSADSVNAVSIKTLTGSWIVFDAVTFSAPAGTTLSAASTFIHLTSAEWEPNILKRGSGGLEQILRIEVENFGPARGVEMSVSGEAARSLTIPSGRSIQEVAYPESKTASQPQVQILTAGRRISENITTDRKPCRQYTIYCLEHSHMDIGYAYLQEKTLALHRQYLEDGLMMSAQTASLPSDDRFRWNIESLVEVDDWLKTASPAQVATFVQAAKNDDLGLSALYCNELTGLCRPEELVALMACADRLRHQYGLTIDSAMISDVPGSTWGTVPMLAQSGVKYFSWGPNGTDHLGAAREYDNRAFYWLSPSGKEKVLVWQSPLGYYPEFDANADSLVGFMKEFERRFPNNPYDMFYDRDTRADNGPANKAMQPFVHDWNSRYAYPHLVISTTSHMFHEFEARYGKTLSTVRGDYTGYWEDGAASTAAATAINRQAAERIAQDEMLWSLMDPHRFPHAAFDAAWQKAVLYDEHTWGADRSWSDPESDFVKSQWAYKQAFALDADRQSQTLEKQALRTVAAPGESHAVAVFNTCSWVRSDLVVLPVALSRAGDVVHDERQQAVPSQRLADGSLAFVSGDIPAMASRRFTISAGKSSFRGGASAADGLLRTGRMSLRLNLQTGAITGWKVNGLPRDLVDAQDKTCRGLNDYLYVLGGDNDKVQYATDVRLTVVDAGPLVASIRVDSAAPGCKTLSRLVQIVDGLDEVRIEDTLDKTQVHEDEAVHIAFNFNVPGATDRMDMPWAVVRPNADQTEYANKNVFPIQRWADVSNTDYGVTCADLDAPMLQIGAITQPRENAGGWRKTAKKGSTLYWNVMNNYWHTNYKAYQPGLATFRYVLRAHGPYDQAATQRFGIDQSQPLLFAPVRAGQPDAHLPLMLSNDAVMVTACRPTADGKGWLIRLFNGSDRAQTVRVGWGNAKGISFQRTDLWGNGAGSAVMPLSFVPMEIVTLRITP